MAGGEKGGLLVLQLVHLSSPVLFCTLKQGPYISGETDIQQVSKWVTVMTQGKSGSTKTGFVCFAKMYALM